MSNNKDSEKIRPGEMPPGTFHYNPGNMSGKKIGNAERQKDDVASPLQTTKPIGNKKHRSEGEACAPERWSNR